MRAGYSEGQKQGQGRSMKQEAVAFPSYYPRNTLFREPLSNPQ
jgi:hypothetical protein